MIFIAKAAEAYAKAHQLGLASENYAREIKFVAARRIGELVPVETGGRGKKTIRTSDSFPTPQRLSEFHKLAEIPDLEFREQIENLKQRQEKITYNRLLRGNFYAMSEKTKYETPQWLYDVLNKEFHASLHTPTHDTAYLLMIETPLTSPQFLPAFYLLHRTS